MGSHWGRLTTGNPSFSEFTAALKCRFVYPSQLVGGVRAGWAGETGRRDDGG